MALDDTDLGDDATGDGEAMGEQPEKAKKSPLDNKAIHQQLLKWADLKQSPNIAEDLTEGELSTIGMRVVEEYQLDENSRSEWLERAKEAINLATQVVEAKTSPWPNASNVCYPIIGMAAVQFSARAGPAIIAGADVVKGIVIGKDDGVPKIDPVSGSIIVDSKTGKPVWVEGQEPESKRARADRIAGHMSWQLTEEMPEWEEETDKLLTVLPIVGCEGRKSYFDPSEGRNVSVRVPAENFVVNYRAKSLDSAPRVTEILKLYPYEVTENIRAGLFLPQDYPPPGTGQDRDEPHEFLEQHRRIDLDDDGYAEPYVVIVHKESQKVARIFARYEAAGVHVSKVDGEITKIEPVQYYTKYDFLKNPDGGFYGVGFGHYLGQMNLAINSTLNQMFDAGTLQNNGGGFVGKNLSLHSGVIKFKLGEWKPVNALGGSIRDSVVPLEHRGASPVLFQLLGMLIAAAEKMASVNEVLTGNQHMANVPATTTLALIEQGLKVFTAVYKRIHTALKSEYQKLYRLNRIYLEEQTTYRRGEEWREIKRRDYLEGSGVAPISDPSMVSDMQELARAEILKEFLNDPLFDGLEIRRRILKAAKVEDIDKLLKANQPPPIELMVKTAELNLRRIEVKARSIQAMAAAVKSLAEADVKVMEPYMTWLTAQLDAMRARVETLDEDQDGSGTTGRAPAAGPGNGAGRLPAMAPAPGNQMAVSLS